MTNRTLDTETEIDFEHLNLYVQGDADLTKEGRILSFGFPGRWRIFKDGNTDKHSMICVSRIRLCFWRQRKRPSV